MHSKRWLMAMPLLSLSLLALTGCPSAPSAPPAAPPAQSGLPELPPDPRAVRRGESAGGGAVGTTPLPTKPVAGSALNKFFPGDAEGYDRVFTQEKSGFALANLNKGGKTVAQLSINDSAANPSAREKFKSASRTLAGYPLTSEGGLAVLVADRYQVKVRATGGGLSAGEQEAWLQKFDLAGLATLK